MTTYTYKCQNESCGHKFEANQKITDDPLTVCPECQQETHRIVVPGGGFILKGEKWFKHSGEY